VAPNGQGRDPNLICLERFSRITALILTAEVNVVFECYVIFMTVVLNERRFECEDDMRD